VGHSGPRLLLTLLSITEQHVQLLRHRLCIARLDEEA